MEFFGGLDVSIDETAVCVVDDKGAVHLQTSVATDAGAITKALKPFLPRPRRVGHEAGALSSWLHPELAAPGLPAVCLETHHVHAATSAQRNKTDATDALGIFPCRADRLVQGGFHQGRALLSHAASADAAA